MDKPTGKLVFESEDAQIEYVKKVIATVLATLTKTKHQALIALSELLLFGVAEGVKDLEDFKKRTEEYVLKVFIPSANKLGPEYVRFFQAMREYEKNNPGTIKAMQDYNMANNDVQVAIVPAEDTSKHFNKPTKH